MNQTVVYENDEYVIIYYLYNGGFIQVHLIIILRIFITH